MLMRAAPDDRRRMNHMDPETKAVHLRLEAWGRWAHENTGAWPAVTVIGRMIEYGALGAASESKPPVSMPDEIAAVDAAVARLGAIDKRVVITYYTKWEPPEVMSRRLKMGVRQFQNVLRRARWRLTGMIGAVGA